MKPLIIPSRFGEHYQVFAQWQTPVGSGELITTNDAAFLFSIITHELIMAAEDWRGALMRLGVSIPPNFFHAADIYHELVKLFQFRQLQLVKIPRLDRLPVIPNGNGWGYCFTRGPDRHPAGESPVAFSSLRDAEIFFQSLKLNEKTLRLFSLKNPRLAGYLAAEQNLAQQFINGLAKQDILAYRVPAPSAAPPPKAVEYIAATAIDREVPLAPQAKNTPASPSAEEKPQAPAPESAANAKVPPQSLDDCAVRLEEARERLKTDGYQSKYTDAEIQALAQKGELDDRFVVRLIETKYAGDTGYLGQIKDSEVKYWSTTFNQMENADTDPATLCALIGVDYTPGKSYTLVIVDTQAPGAGQAATIVPTHKNLGNFAKSEIKGINPEAVDAVMTPEYNDEYAQHVEKFKTGGGSIDKGKDISDYADANFANDAEKECFESRMKIHERLGANEHYTGNGTTKNLIENCPNKCGVMETFTYDKNPQTLVKLETSGSAKRVHMRPI